jgi:hypothetical protein
VLNSLIFPAHEQHHNNSFLCAALVMGQSNIAAGATIGSNHNSRSPDGEIVAGRGFWPGLCVSLKHNSRFASFSILAKGDYPAELDIPIPFSLVSNDVTNDQLVIMPGYWFMYNMYALARNSWKYVDRDKREEKIQQIEYDFLAPDTVNEMFDSLRLFERQTAKAYVQQHEPGKQYGDDELLKIGRQLLKGRKEVLNKLEICAEDFECSKRKVLLVKAPQAHHLFEELIIFYGVNQLMDHVEQKNISAVAEIQELLAAIPARDKWQNIGGQLLPASSVKKMKEQVKNSGIDSWDALHQYYTEAGEAYPQLKQQHALASLIEVADLKSGELTPQAIDSLFNIALSVKEWMAKGIYEARAKDYQNKFRKLVYDTNEEMNKVMGRLEDNSFIRQTNDDLKVYKERVATIRKNIAK